MGASMETTSPTHLHKESASFLTGSSISSPSSDKRFWSTLRSRIDALLEDRDSKFPNGQLSPRLDLILMNVGDSGCAKRLKEDALLLIRGFDSIAHTLSQLSSNLDTALQGAKDLAKPPTLTEIYHSSLKKSESERKEKDSGKQQNEEQLNKGLKRKYDDHSSEDQEDGLKDEKEQDPKYGTLKKAKNVGLKISELERKEKDSGKQQNEEQLNKELKRKYDDHCSKDQEDDSKNEKEQDPKYGTLKKAKNLAVSMATKAASLARELKSIKSDLCFMQERCSLLEKENRRLRDGFFEGIRPEEDDLVMLQLEALLAEKSRLANENANLIRENRCLNQLVEYHQLTSQEDFSVAAYEHVIQGMCLDFLSPPPPIPEEDATDEDHGSKVAEECF